MVKFSFIALASALATASATTGTIKKSIKLGNRNLRRGDPATEALLKKATPYKRGNKNNAAARRLDGEKLEIDGTYNLKFSECVDVKTTAEDLFSDELVEYAQAGSVVAAKSYVLFHVCQGDDCYYEADADLYMVDLPTYLTNVATYHANKRNDYCEACEEFEDYCTQEEEEAEEAAEEEEEEGDADEDEEEDKEEEEQEDNNEEEQEENDQEEEQEEDDKEDEEQEEDDKDEEENNDNEEDKEEEGEENEDEDGNDRRRQLKKINRILAKEQIDCEQCQAYECYVDEDDLDDQAVRKDELDEQVSEWIADLAECKESGTQWNGMDLYIGAMCSPFGDGVELAVFVDDECTMYTNQQSFYKTWNPNNDNEDGYNYLTYAENFIKSAFSEVTPCMQQEFADPDAEEEEEDDGNYEVNDYCQQIMEGDVADFNNCAADADEQEEEAEQDDQYNWYTYDLKEADDIDEVCDTINQLEGEYSYVYDEERSGTWYKRNKKGQIISEDEGGLTMPELTPAVIGVIVAVCLIVIGGAAFLLKPKKKKNSDSSEPVYQGGTML